MFWFTNIFIDKWLMALKSILWWFQTRSAFFDETPQDVFWACFSYLKYILLMYFSFFCFSTDIFYKKKMFNGLKKVKRVQTVFWGRKLIWFSFFRMEWCFLLFFWFNIGGKWLSIQKIFDETLLAVFFICVTW